MLHWFELIAAVEAVLLVNIAAVFVVATRAMRKRMTRFKISTTGGQSQSFTSIGFDA